MVVHYEYTMSNERSALSVCQTSWLKYDYGRITREEKKAVRGLSQEDAVGSAR